MQSGQARAADNVLTPIEVQQGYELLFDGTLAGFQSHWADYVKGDSTNTGISAKWILDSACACIRLPSGNATDLRSVKTYRDFDFRMTYKTDGGQGIMYRSTVQYDRSWQSGVEYTINNVTYLGKDNPAAAYDLYAPDPVVYNAYNTGLWNEARIIVIGDSVEHWSNGVKVTGYKYHSPDFWEAYNRSKWYAESRLTNKVAGDRQSGYIEEGYLGLQGDHGGKWQIKNLKITDKPCFGPASPALSTCSPVSIRNDAMPGKTGYTVLRMGAGTITLTLADNGVKSASLIGLDGRLIVRASLTEAGRKAVFPGGFGTGIYLLRLDLASGSVTRKISLL
ncbi:MAG: hypothetical protein JWO30_3606 [Fibrobacteres bacterium]|nr:hypothetical protein [Fibrobacterota bacterium]